MADIQKKFIIILRSFSTNGCLKYIRQIERDFITLTIRHRYLNYDHNKFVSSFVNEALSPTRWQYQSQV